MSVIVDNEVLVVEVASTLVATEADLSDTAPQAVGTATAGTSLEASRADHVHAHGNQLGGSLHALANNSSAGFAPTLAGVSGRVLTDQGNGTAAYAAISVSSVSGVLPVANGGTNASTASGARTSLGAAATGANSDITSLSGLTTPLSVVQGGTGGTTAAQARLNLSAATSGANSDITSLSGLTTPLSIPQGGTGATTAAGARSNLSAAGSGVNSDITELTGITTPLTVGQGGTGASTAAGARSSLGAAASGANSDITSLSGLTTPLSVGQGGTGASTASGARTSLSAAQSGANSDITSLSGLTTPLSVAQGGTGANTEAGARTSLSAAQSGANSDITSLSGLTTPLSIAQGGTGSATKNFVDLTTDQTVGGNKAFSGTTTMSGLTQMAQGTLEFTATSGNNIIKAPTNTSSALLIQGTAGNNYLRIDTTTGAMVTHLPQNTQLGIDAVNNTSQVTISRLRGPSHVAGGTADQAEDLLIDSPSSKGAGDSGIMFRTPTAGVTGTSLNTTYATRLRVRQSAVEVSTALTVSGILTANSSATIASNTTISGQLTLNATNPVLYFNGSGLNRVSVRNNKANAFNLIDDINNFSYIGIDTTTGNRKIYFGHDAATGSDGVATVTLRGANYLGGSGTNNQGNSDVVIQSGNSKGNATSAVIIQTAQAGASGNIANTPTTTATFGPTVTLARQLVLQAGMVTNTTGQAGDYTATTTDGYIGITSTAAARTVTLPAVATVTDGFILRIKDESGAAGTNNITIDGNGSETIDGATTKAIASNYGSVTLVKRNSAWWVV